MPSHNQEHRVGSILIALSVFLILLSMLLSEDLWSFVGDRPVANFLNALSNYAYLFSIDNCPTPTTDDCFFWQFKTVYAVLAAIAMALYGWLLRTGALHLPRRSQQKDRL